MPSKSSVLASEGKTAGLSSGPSVSLASDIVELVIFTTDDNFLQTLREAVGESRRLWHVPSADKISDLLLAGQVGILVLDVQALPEAASGFVTEIKRQFPELVVIVAGNREAETSLAPLVMSGVIYRFIHKPMSPDRAKLFTDAAVKKYGQQRSRVLVPPVVAWIPSGNRRLLIGITAGVLLVGIVAMWAFRHESRENGMRVGGLAKRESVRTPSEVSGRTGLAESRDRLVAQAENALLEERLDEAARTIDAARKSGIDAGRIAFLTAQLVKARERLKQAMAQTTTVKTAKAAQIAQRTEPGAAGGAEEGLSPSSTRAAERTEETRLTDPAGDSARFVEGEPLQIESQGNPTEAAREPAAGGQQADQEAAADRRPVIAAAPREDRAIERVEESAHGADSSAVARPLAAAAAQPDPVTNLTGASQLTLLKSVKPLYPMRAQRTKTEGWVELDFTVTESGEVKGITVHAAYPAGVFDNAAIAALSQWRYKPLPDEGKRTAQHSRIRIRFALAD